MSKERFAERQAEVKDAATRLAEAVAQPESELVRDATIQRFEFTFEDRHIARDYAPLLGAMAAQIQNLSWD
jgi:hypothetical protein